MVAIHINVMPALRLRGSLNAVKPLEMASTPVNAAVPLENACNNRKGNRTPEEAGIKLLHPPRPFSLHTGRHLMRLLGRSDEQWKKYLFY